MANLESPSSQSGLRDPLEEPPFSMNVGGPIVAFSASPDKTLIAVGGRDGINL